MIFQRSLLLILKSLPVHHQNHWLRYRIWLVKSGFKTNDWFMIQPKREKANKFWMLDGSGITAAIKQCGAKHIVYDPFKRDTRCRRRLKNRSNTLGYKNYVQITTEKKMERTCICPHLTAQSDLQALTIARGSSTKYFRIHSILKRHCNI